MLVARNLTRLRRRVAVSSVAASLESRALHLKDQMPWTPIRGTHQDHQLAQGLPDRRRTAWVGDHRAVGNLRCRQPALGFCAGCGGMYSSWFFARRINNSSTDVFEDGPLTSHCRASAILTLVVQDSQYHWPDVRVRRISLMRTGIPT